jgi:hypothetical protein
MLTKSLRWCVNFTVSPMRTNWLFFRVSTSYRAKNGSVLPLKSKVLYQYTDQNYQNNLKLPIFRSSRAERNKTTFSKQFGSRGIRYNKLKLMINCLILCSKTTLCQKLKSNTVDDFYFLEFSHSRFILSQTINQFVESLQYCTALWLRLQNAKYDIK